MLGWRSVDKAERAALGREHGGDCVMPGQVSVRSHLRVGALPR